MLVFRPDLESSQLFLRQLFPKLAYEFAQVFQMVV